jgi:hypothetical protein
MRHITRTLVFIPRQYTYPGVPVRSLNPDFNPLRRVFYAWRKYDLHNWLDCGQRQYPDGYWHKFYSGRLTYPRWVLVDFSGYPVQVFQITAINSATQLTVTPAANPAIAAGTAYAILLSDSLSVDGLAQNIAETLTLYQRNMSGFADVMNGAGDVTITINGVAVTVPGQKSLAKKALTRISPVCPG